MKKNLLLLAALVFLTSNLFSQTLQDWPCGGLLAGTQFTLNSPCVIVSTAGMTYEGYNPGSCGSTGNDDGWAWFIGDGGSTTVTWTGLSANGILHVLEVNAPPCGGISNIYCSNVAGNGNESVTFPSISGTTYLIRVQRQGSNTTITGCLGVTSVAPVGGCTNPAAANYNPAATFDDGTCTFPGVDYTHPIAGGADEFVGACMVNDCGPFTYTDNGGPAGNYSLNIGQAGFGGIYRVFCPETASNCMSVTFNSFNVETTFDYLTIGNGPTQNSPFFTTPPALATGRLTGNLGGSTPFTYTSTDASGCLTFRFFSDNSVTAPGWSAVLQCVPCAGGPNGTDNNDCQTLTALCAGTALPGNSSGPGLVSDGCVFGQCPAGGENFSNWYTFQAQTTGTLNITVTPTTPTDDYDFAIYGPNVTCATLGNPVRCSDAAATGVTGMGGDVDATEPAAGNGQLSTMNVVAGQQYIMVVDEWTATGSGYTLSFGGTASLDCAVLPVELAEFNAEYVPSEDVVDIFWRTESERDNDRFEVERSTDGINWEIIHVVKGSGTTTYETQYYVADANPYLGVNYYRLNQWDTDGNGKYSEVIVVNILDNVYDMLTVFPNPTKESVEVIFNSYSKEQVMMTLTNSSGKVIVNTPIDAVSGGNRFNLDLAGQSAGIYIVSIITRDKVYREKLIKE